MKKRVIGLFALLSAFFVQIVSAYPSSFGASQIGYWISQGIENARIIMEPVFITMFGDYTGYDFLWTKVAIFVLLFVIIRYILGKIDTFKDNNAVQVVISFIVSLFAIRYMGENDIIRGILLPYGVLGVALVTLLPFLIFFYFVHKTNMGSGGRKLSWMFFAVIFGVLWYNRFGDLSPLANQIYGWTLVGVIAVLMFDQKIHEYFGLAEDAEMRRKRIAARIAHMDVQLGNLTPHRGTSKYVDDKIKSLEETRTLLIKKL